MSESVVAVEPQVSVGERVRELRQRRRLTLREVAERAELSESFLSQIERGRTSASIASLQRIAAALALDVSDLFTADVTATPRVLRRETRHEIGFGTGARKALLTPKPFHSLEVVAAEFEPGGSTGAEPYVHGDSEEVFVVVSGRVRLQLGHESFALEAGDSVHYRSSIPHRVVNESDEPAEVLFVISPPSY